MSHLNLGQECIILYQLTMPVVVTSRVFLHFDAEVRVGPLFNHLRISTLFLRLLKVLEYLSFGLFVPISKTSNVVFEFATKNLFLLCLLLIK